MHSKSIPSYPSSESSLSESTPLASRRNFFMILTKKKTGSRYPMDPTIDAVEVLLTTGGMPMNARIEILQGPDTNKQAGPGHHT